MPLLTPLYALTVPLILLFSIPLAFLATITSLIAFSILSCRVLVVYAELALTIIPYYLALSLQHSDSDTNTSLSQPERDLSSLSRSKSASSSSSTILASSRRRHKRRSSSTSVESLTPVASTASITTTVAAAPSTSLPFTQSVGPQRDFEGVGGWKLDPPSEEEKPWDVASNRLELPADHGRRHRRSLTSGAVPGERRRQERSWSPELVMAPGSMSPNTSRVRTPPTRNDSGDVSNTNWASLRPFP